MVESAAGEIVFVPASLNQNLSRIRDKAGAEVVNVPVPYPIPDEFGVCIPAGSNRVVDEPELCAKARDASSDAGCVVFGTRLERPSASSLAVSSKFSIEHK